MAYLINCLKNPAVRCQATADEVQGRIVLDVAYYAGTYGMGGPGFFGLLLEAGHDAPEEWLLCTLWGAGNWIVVNGQWLLANPEQYAQQKPLHGEVHKQSIHGWLKGTGETWDEFRPLVVGQPLHRFFCEKHSCELIVGSSTLQITKSVATRPTFAGSRKPRRLSWRQDLRKAWVLANIAAIQM